MNSLHLRTVLSAIAACALFSAPAIGAETVENLKSEIKSNSVDWTTSCWYYRAWYVDLCSPEEREAILNCNIAAHRRWMKLEPKSAAPALADGVDCGWKAGVAKVKITPREMVWMAGYGKRKTPPVGVLQDLWAKSLAVEDRDGNLGATALFFQGAGADQNPLPRRKLSLAVQYGKELAAAVKQALQDELAVREPVLSMKYEEVPLAMKDHIPSDDMWDEGGYEVDAVHCEFGLPGQ